MKFKGRFSQSILLVTLVSCGSKEVAPVQPASNSEAIGRLQSKNVLPGNQERFLQQSGQTTDPVILAHDTPSLNQEARGPYSFLGAAKEFSSICGLVMPDWVLPIEGEYNVGKISGEFVSQARLEFKIDPLRRDELIGMITEGTAIRRIGIPRLIFGSQQIENQAPARFTSYAVIVNSKRSDKITIGLFSDGTVKLSNKRGPEGWDQ